MALKTPLVQRIFNLIVAGETVELAPKAQESRETALFRRVIDGGKRELVIYPQLFNVKLVITRDAIRSPISRRSTQAASISAMWCG